MSTTTQWPVALEDKHKKFSKTKFSNNITELGIFLREYPSTAGGRLHEVLELSGLP